MASIVYRRALSEQRTLAWKNIRQTFSIIDCHFMFFRVTTPVAERCSFSQCGLSVFPGFFQNFPALSRDTLSGETLSRADSFEHAKKPFLNICLFNHVLQMYCTMCFCVIAFQRLLSIRHGFFQSSFLARRNTTFLSRNRSFFFGRRPDFVA